MINDLKARREKLEDKVETLTTQRDELQKKLDRIELEQSLNLSAKSGLNGIAENPFVLKLLDHVGPALGGWLQKVVEKGGPSQLGAPEGLSPEVQKQVVEISNWFAAQPGEIQNRIYEMIDLFANIEKPEELIELLERTNNLLKYGLTGQDQQHNGTGTWN